MSFLDDLTDALLDPSPVVDRAVPDGAMDRWRTAFLGAAMASDLPQVRELVGDPGKLRRRLRGCWTHLGAAVGPVVPVDDQIAVLEQAAGGRTARFSAKGAITDDLRRMLVGGSLWALPERYLAAIGATSREGRRLPFGDLLLALGPREATVALLVAEALQSTGDADEMRYPSWVLRFVASRREWDESAYMPPDGLPSLARLHAFGVVREEVDGREYVVEDRLSWLEVAVADPPPPLHALVREALDGRLPALAGTTTGPTDGVRQLAELVAHELGNVVPTLDLSVEALRAEREDDDPRLRRIAATTRRLAAFAKQVREVLPSTSEAPRRASVLGLLNDALDATAGERNGHLRVRLDVEDIEVVVPAARVQLAFVQLLRNAAQAAARTSRVVELAISARAVEDRVELRFDDDGPGIPAHLAGSVFERGVSGRGASGLGLALVRDVVERELGGSVSHSVTGNAPGAHFLLTFSRST